MAYSSLIEASSLRPTTRRVYLSMFQRFSQFLTENDLNLNTLNKSDILLFLNSTNPNIAPSRRNTSRSRVRKAYLLILEKVFDHLSFIGWKGESPINRFDPDAYGRDQKLRILTPDERVRLIALIETRLDEVRRVQTRTVENFNNRMEFDAYWTAVRNIALVSTLLGAGVKVGDIGRVTLNCLGTPLSLNKVDGFSSGVSLNCVDDLFLDLSRTGHAHRPKLLKFSLPALELWCSLAFSVRNDMTPRSPMFFACKSGYGKFSKNIVLTPSSIHRITREFMNAASISGSRACAQTLRNTYAAILIQEGASNEELAVNLGLADERRIKSLKAAVQTSQFSQSEQDCGLV